MFLYMNVKIIITFCSSQRSRWTGRCLARHLWEHPSYFSGYYLSPEILASPCEMAGPKLATTNLKYHQNSVQTMIDWRISCLVSMAYHHVNLYHSILNSRYLVSNSAAIHLQVFVAWSDILGPTHKSHRSLHPSHSGDSPGLDPHGRTVPLYRLWNQRYVKLYLIFLPF